MERGYWCTHTKIPPPPDIEELRPISLTSQLSKICEKFAEQWIVNDITPNLDPMQFGSRQNHSTTHNLVSLMDFVYKACEEPGSVCTLVTTDFVKAFDTVDHTVAVKCLLDLGVRPSLIPWICNFMSNCRQWVRYHLSYSFPVAQMVEHGASNAKIMGSIPRESKSW